VSDHRHKMPAGYRAVKTSVLGGLHHEYRLVKEAVLTSPVVFCGLQGLDATRSRVEKIALARPSQQDSAFHPAYSHMGTIRFSVKSKR